MTPTRTPTRRASLSVNTSSLPSIMEFSIPSEFTVPSAQGSTIPENIDVIIRELQPIAIEQQPMVLGEERVLAKYQKNPESPVLDLIANAVGETFLRRSPVIISSESDSSDSPLTISYASESPKEQIDVRERAPSPETITRPIDIAELIEFTKTQIGFNTIANIARNKDQTLFEALLRFKKYYQSREEIIEVGAAIFHNIQQQKKVEDEAKKLRVLLEGNLEKLAEVRKQHSRQMANAFTDAVRSNLNVHAREFVEIQRKKNSDQLTHSLQNQIDISASHSSPQTAAEPAASTAISSTITDDPANQPSAYNAPGPVSRDTPQNLPAGVVHLLTGVSFLPPQPVPRPTPPPRPVQVAAVRCFKCRKLGHMQSHCPEYQCPYCRKYAPGHYQKECLKRAIHMQNTRTTYARRRALEAAQRASISRNSPSPPPYDNEADYDDDVYTYENMDGER